MRSTFRMATSKLLAATLGFAMCWTAAGVASAQGFDATHPRRAEVNNRLENQNDRIHQERAAGELSGRQARRLHRRDRRIRAEERSFARADGGHITRGEQRTINRQENRVSNRIGQ